MELNDMIIKILPSTYLLIVSVIISGMYLVTLPFSGEIYDIDSLSNHRLGIPLEDDDVCNVSSEANMSLRLAYVNGINSLVLTGLLIIYNITAKNSNEAWPVIIVWITSAISFFAQILCFIILSIRVSVFYLSCSNPAKLNGACPTTRYKHLRSDITDQEMCNFNPITLTLKNSESDVFIDCLNSETFSTYNQGFARYDISTYYTAASLCLRNETQTISNDLSWCFYWGCSAECTKDTYYLNIKWFLLDILLLVIILVSYIIIMSEFYVVKGFKKE